MAARAGFPGGLHLLGREEREALALAYERGASLVRPVSARSLFPATSVPGDCLPEGFAGAAAIGLFALSLGSAIDEAIEEDFSHGRPLAATLLDAWGSEAAERFADGLDALLVSEAGKNGFAKRGFRFSPGYGSLSARANGPLLALFAKPPALARSDSGAMVPRKSVVALIAFDRG